MTTSKLVVNGCATNIEWMCQKPNIFKYIPSSSNIQNYLLIPPLGVGYRDSLTSPAGALYSAAPVIHYGGCLMNSFSPFLLWSILKYI